MRATALRYLRGALNQPTADFRPGQWESIQAILESKRLLVVERTGWGKSMVYFLATRLLRNAGAGPSLLISPLLALMRNQLEAAARIGVKAETINSSNPQDRARIEQALRDNQVDILLVSPERLADDAFVQNVLSPIADRVGLFVVDEAHCISDWGHDFRPDYRRIVRVLQALPSNIPVLATTATANDRVVRDVMAQLGKDITLVRGPLLRESLKLQNITMPSPAARMAWLAETIPTLPNTGIVYVLTKRDAERVAEWLRIVGISARAYYSGVLPRPSDGALVDNALKQRGIAVEQFNLYDEDVKSALFREVLEEELLANRVKALVSTVALGMGFDKPDLCFVIHFQRPSSVVHYYQQVGRAGRAVEEAYGVLFHGEEDDAIAAYFIKNAFPPQKNVSQILEALDRSEGGLSTPQMEKCLNLSKGQIAQTLKFLSAESPSPVTKIDNKWVATPAAKGYMFDQSLVEEIATIRHLEQRQMQTYMRHQGCLMRFLGEALDDPDVRDCGKCAGCQGRPLLSPEYNRELTNRAAIFIKRNFQPLSPKKKWPSYGPLPIYGFTGMIGDAFIAQEGRALSLWRDAGWGRLVADGKYVHGRFDDSLVTACVTMIREWRAQPYPQWVTCIPSLKHPDLVPDFARRLAVALGLEFKPALSKVVDNPEQKTQANSYQQAHNLDGVFSVDPANVSATPCFLIDDMTDSGWTFTVAAALLRREGCQAVFPLALALNSPRMD